MRTKAFLILTAIIMIVFYNGCQNEPEPIAYGEDNCDYCRMLITDNRYGSELVTDKGKKHKFDSIECLAAFSMRGVDEEEISSLWVTGFTQPDILINVDNAYFLNTELLKSPMGLNLTAFSDQSTLGLFQTDFNGQQLSWRELKKYVFEEWDKAGY